MNMETNYNGHSKKSGIYQITNKVNGRIYIGSAQQFKRRWAQHKNSLHQIKHYNKFLQADFNKCGMDAFVFEVIEVVDGDTKARREIEQTYIDKQIEQGNWEQCYNLIKKTVLENGPRKVKKEPWNKGKKWPEMSGENHPRFGLKHSDETKQAISKTKTGNSVAWNKGIPSSDETRQKISSFFKGRPSGRKGFALSEEHKQKIGLGNKGKISPNKGKKVSLLTKKKQSQAKKGKPQELARKNLEGIILVSPDGLLFECLDGGLNEFAKRHGLQAGNLSMLILGKRKSHKGWIIKN
jgi:group I intron endonuclease